MKQILVVVALVATAFSQSSFAQDSTQQSALPPLLSLYYHIKDDLTAGNAKAASASAASFVKTMNSIDYKTISEEQLPAIIKDAGKISDTKDIKKQREYFVNFSAHLSALAKTVKLSDKPIYEVYCPMKKAYWLSSEKTVKNPYYGSSMLSCGEITDTIQ